MRIPARRLGTWGFSLPELLLVSAIFVGFLLISFMLLESGKSVWDRTSSSGSVMFELQKARAAVERDLRETSYGQVGTGDGTAARTSTQEGDNALWCLSSVDPSSKKNVLDDSGAPLWQRNILYYLAAPADHDRLFGVVCQSQDERCPHKVLIRRQLKTQVLDPDEPSVPQETLMSSSEAQTFTLTPDGFDLFPDTPQAKSALIARGLLELDVKKGQGVATYPGEVQVTVRGFELDKATQKVAVGRSGLLDSPFTHTLVFSVFPDN